jgi:hypothetical protein
MVPYVTSYIRCAGNGTTSTSSVCMTLGPPHPLLIIQTHPHLPAATSGDLYDLRRPACVLRYGHHAHVSCRAVRTARGWRACWWGWRAGACWLAGASNSYWKPWAPISLGAFCVENALTLISIDSCSVATRPTIVVNGSCRVATGSVLVVIGLHSVRSCNRSKLLQLVTSNCN